jgi:hypothetical protein
MAFIHAAFARTLFSSPTCHASRSRSVCSAVDAIEVSGKYDVLLPPFEAVVDDIFLPLDDADVDLLAVVVAVFAADFFDDLAPPSPISSSPISSSFFFGSSLHADEDDDDDFFFDDEPENFVSGSVLTFLLADAFEPDDFDVAADAVSPPSSSSSSSCT